MGLTKFERVKMLEILRTIAFVLMACVAIKTVVGLHFPWEKCECCGKKWKEHKTKSES
jgi:hypothetical protein